MKKRSIANHYQTYMVNFPEYNLVFRWKLRDLVYFIFRHYSSEVQDIISISLPDGRIMYWNSSLAHYCFAKARITEEQFIEHCLIGSQNHSI